MIHVLGADLMDGTPIYDIKPYITYADSHADARSGFVDEHQWTRLEVIISQEAFDFLLSKGLDAARIDELRQVLKEDPRPQYQDNPDKIYGMPFAGIDVHFYVNGKRLTILAQ